MTAPHYADVSKVFFTYSHDVLTKQKTGAEAVKAMAEDIKGIVGK